MSDEAKTPEQLEAERVKLMAELENEETDIPTTTGGPSRQEGSPEPPEVDMIPRGKKAAPIPPRKFVEIKHPKQDNTVIILLVVGIVIAVGIFMYFNLKKAKENGPGI